ncbi:hypothetical protein DM01DRAFT_1342905 [Hesseltinella vesiculosa]|uniref:Uncharacterized protein n=1 Tax=Hesseltinella vesiculosa TaxID=101127 RepID=A0A1X2GSH9_9FUNG|nr:hypothetical protein DM01DRAFT_1342905 [Hesseltinella vesiculosa]
MQTIPKRVIICPLTINKDNSVHHQQVVIEGTSCVISTTINEVELHRVSSPAPPPPPFTIVTAASANHLCALESLLYNLYDYRAQFPAFPRIIVYNLGVNKTTQLPTLHQLRDNGLIDELLTFEYDAYPAFWDISASAGEYGWKTAMVYETAKRVGGRLLWLDAGNQITSAFLSQVIDNIQQGDGFWSPRSAFRMARLTHPGMFDYFQADPNDYARNINCNGAVFGLDASNQTIMDTIIEPWYQCGLDKNCIAPPGSSRKNHRQDQAVLTFLAYRSGHSCQWSHRFFKMQTHRDIACRANLLERETLRVLNHPSTTDYPPWTPSDTFDLVNHPEWRYPGLKTFFP